MGLRSSSSSVPGGGVASQHVRVVRSAADEEFLRIGLDHVSLLVGDAHLASPRAEERSSPTARMVDEIQLAPFTWSGSSSPWQRRAAHGSCLRPALELEFGAGAVAMLVSRRYDASSGCHSNDNDALLSGLGVFDRSPHRFAGGRDERSDEYVVYDPERGMAHMVDGPASRLRSRCDGSAPTRELLRRAAVDE